VDCADGDAIDAVVSLLASAPVGQIRWTGKNRVAGVDKGEDIAAIAAALGCDAEAARALKLSGRLVDAGPATVLVHQGEVATHCWLILDGTVRCEVVSSDGRMSVVATHPTGDIVGCFGMATHPLAGSLVTGGRTRLLTVGESVVERLCLDNPDFALAIARTYARQAGQITDRLAARISLTAAGRIYARLLELADAQHVIRPAPVVSALAVSVQTTRETTSRAISALERRGIISRDDKQLIINAPRMLEDMIV